MAWTFHSGKAISKQIADRIAVDILTGKVLSSQRLPDIPEMSKITGVSANTVVDAYNELIREGIILNRGKLIINSDLTGAQARRDKIADEACVRFSQELSALGLDIRQQMRAFGEVMVRQNNAAKKDEQE